MTIKRRGLGRGLSSLLGETKSEKITKADVGETKNSLPIELLKPGKYQPRQDMAADSLQELSESIREQGVIQPIIVRPLSDKQYEIIAGERRWRASQLAGLDEVPVVVREVNDQAAIAMALIENIQRENLNPIEEAQSLMRLIDEFNLTQQEAATAVGRSRSAVANLLRLLNLPALIKEMLKNKELEMGHARALLSLTDAEQTRAAKHIKLKGLSVRASESYIKSLLTVKKPEKTAVTKDPNTMRLQNELEDKLNAKVVFKPKIGGKGEIVISYNSLDELEGILQHIK